MNSSCMELTFMQMGTSGKTRRKSFAPLTTLSLRLMSSWTVVSCLAERRAPFPQIRMPHWPYASVVPFVEPPVGMGIDPF